MANSFQMRPTTTMHDVVNRAFADAIFAAKASERSTTSGVSMANFNHLIGFQDIAWIAFAASLQRVAAGRLSCIREVASVCGHVAGSTKYFQIANRVIECIPVFVMNMLSRLKFAAKMSFHHKSVLRLIVAIANHDVAVAVLDVFAFEFPNYFRPAVSSPEGVVVGAIPASLCRLLATFDGACLHTQYIAESEGSNNR